MATLKDHQNAMVDLLANGSAIPASAARLAHALHDVLGLLLERDSEPHSSFINDVRLAADLSAVPERGSVLINNLRAELAESKTNLDCAENEVMCPRAVVEANPKVAIGYIMRANSAMTDSLRKRYLNSALEALNYKPHRRVGGFVDSNKSYVVGETPLEEKLAADLAMGLADGEPLLRAELANVTNQRDTYKARCESLELELEVTSSALREVQDAVALEGIDLTNLLLRARNK